MLSAKASMDFTRVSYGWYTHRPSSMISAQIFPTTIRCRWSDGESASRENRRRRAPFHHDLHAIEAVGERRMRTIELRGAAPRARAW